MIHATNKFSMLEYLFIAHLAEGQYELLSSHHDMTSVISICKQSCFNLFIQNSCTSFLVQMFLLWSCRIVVTFRTDPDFDMTILVIDWMRQLETISKRPVYLELPSLGIYHLLPVCYECMQSISFHSFMEWPYPYAHYLSKTFYRIEISLLGVIQISICCRGI